MSEKTFLPGSTIGILGSGQLGRMLILAARPLAYRTCVFSPEQNSPAGQLADVEICADYNDLDAVRRFAQSVDVITYEFENVPSATAVACDQFAPLRPGGQLLHVAQNRLREKQCFLNLGLPTAPFRPVHSLADLEAGLAELGCPAVLKTAVLGYDGKGQQKISQPQEAAAAWQAVGQADCILESWVPFERELSMIAARGIDGRFAHYGLIENSHQHHILDISKWPTAVAPAIADAAQQMVHTLAQALELVGVLCVEFFLTADGQLLLNEIAPRPHNSGHLTIEAAVTSQFEQQLRAVCGLPLGDTSYRQPAAMANLLGDLWPAADQQPDWTAVLQQPTLKVHLYGKQAARPGRKMGHLTALANHADQAEIMVKEARRQLGKTDALPVAKGK